MLRRLVRLIVLVGAAGAAATVASAAAHAQAPPGGGPPNATGAGTCTASATIDGGPTIDPYVSSGPWVIPLSGTATYQGTVVASTTPRPIKGEVVIVTPPGIPDISVSDDWTWDDPEATGTDAGGSVSWDLPSFLPRGVPIRVEGYHQESGTTVCEGWIEIELEGGLWDSPLAPVSLGGAALAAVGLGFAARAKGVA